MNKVRFGRSGVILLSGLMAIWLAGCSDKPAEQEKQAAKAPAEMPKKEAMAPAPVPAKPAAPVVTTAAKEVMDEGKALSVNRKKGNCLACHMMDDGVSPGNIAPPLLAMSSRYQDKAQLRAQIWDPTVANPDSTMPPFGKHNILSAGELDKVVEYIWSL
ncbi:MAG: sulfur oxidation c-type cytochrome SoxX [Candidatus Sedimenticola sp. PURPLELP]